MLKRKAQLGLFLCIAVSLVIVLLLLLINFIAGIDWINVKGTLIISMEIDDIGTEVVSILNAKSSDIKYMEVLGDLDTTNYPPDFDSDFDNTLKKIKAATGYSGYNFTIYSSTKPSASNIIGSYGKGSKEKGINMEIPLPGARVGKFKGLVRLEKW